MNDAPSVKANSIENSVIKMNEIVDSTLEEAQKLRAGLEHILAPQSPMDTANGEKQPHSVKMIADIEKGYETMLEVRYVIRDIMDRLAL